MSKKNNIKCPHCGCEYLPAEIFYADNFLGRPKNIIKDDDGSILGFNDNDMNTYETFVCEKCNKSFSIEATVTFKTDTLIDLFADETEFFK